MLSNTIDSTCILPWRGIYTDIFNTVSPCCTVDNRSNFNEDSSLADVYNNDQFKRIRRHIKNGEVAPDCERCVYEKRTGVSDNMSMANRSYTEHEMIEIINKTNDDGTLIPEDISLGYLNLFNSNTCNLTCRICSPFASSAWGAKLPDNRVIATDRSKNILSEFEGYLKDVRRVYFVGGEPFLIHDHKKIVEYILQSGQAHKTKLNYNTNGTVLTNPYAEYLKTVWYNFNTVHLSFSVDGYGKMAEYTRQGLVWEEFYSNYVDMFNSPDVNVKIKATVGNSNVWHVPDMVKSFILDGLVPVEVDRITDFISFTAVKRVTGGLITDIPADTKVVINERFVDIKEWLRANTKWSEKSINFLDPLMIEMNSSDTYNSDEVNDNFGKMDKMFGTSFYDVQPEYAPMLLK